jgi:PII-like signaling protein
VDEDGIKLTSYFGGQRRAGGKFAGDALVELYRQREIAASIVLRGIAIAVDTSARIKAVLDETRLINRGGLITLERARFLSAEIEPLGLTETAGEAAELTVYFSRQDTVFGVPASEAMCELLHRRGIDGATALAGADGTTGGHRQRPHLLARNADGPMMVVAVGGQKALRTVLPEIGGLLRHPRMTLGRVQICKRDGQLIEEPGTPPPYDDDGLACWQKLAVYASAGTRQDGQPVHRALIRRLLAAGISGVTTQPGVWGYHGQWAPHGDQHLLHPRQHVPAVTSVVEPPQRISAAFGIIDELTRQHGLVTCENVPVMLP